MAIPEEQLDTWSHQGAISQSRNTYAEVKNALEDASSPYYLNDFESFLQGSYANDTNVFRDSDVDIVLRLDSVWYHDAPTLPADQYAAFERAYPGETNYGLAEFKSEVATFKEAFAQRRGILVVKTFNEGKEVPSSKPGGKSKTEQYVIRPRDQKPVSIAVIYQKTSDPNGALLWEFAMVTTPNNELIGTITDRMPAVLPRDD